MSWNIAIFLSFLVKIDVDKKLVILDEEHEVKQIFPYSNSWLAVSSKVVKES